MISETTSYLGLQLPHPSNSLEDDVPRLRSAINGIDSKFQALDTLLASDDPALNTIQELVNALKQATADLVDHIGAGGAEHAVATTSTAGFLSSTDKTLLNNLDGHVGSGGLTAHAAAAGNTSGFMSAADKAKLNEVTLGILIDSLVLNVAANGDTTLTPTGGYVAGSIMLFKNGQKMKPSTYIATNGTSITLGSPAQTTDDFELVKFKRPCRHLATGPQGGVTL